MVVGPPSPRSATSLAPVSGSMRLYRKMSDIARTMEGVRGRRPCRTAPPRTLDKGYLRAEALIASTAFRMRLSETG